MLKQLLIEDTTVDVNDLQVLSKTSM
jgi:hypothetical protein